jgi:osomolarity two-component system, response regulator SKN7
MASQHQLACLTENVYATQKQVQQLQAHVGELSQANQMLVKEVVALQKVVSSQRQAQQEVLNYLETTAQRQSQGARRSPSIGVGALEDHVELRRVRELLNGGGGGDGEGARPRGIYSSPDSAASSTAMYGPIPDVNGLPIVNDLDLTKFTVYPVGQTVGIDPFHSDHIHNIPYPIPQTSSIVEAPGMPPDAVVPNAAQSPDMSTDWGPKKPYIYLVEDDRICSKIGHKFLTSLGCTVERAVCAPCVPLPANISFLRGYV